MKVRRVPKKIVPMLLSSFNDGSFMFRTSTCNFLLRKEDVHDCFLLPMGPREVPLLGTGRSKNTSQDSSRELKESWRERFGVGGSSNAILIGKLYSELLKSKAGDEDFKRMFVLYSMSTFLAPMTNSTVDLKLLLAVDDVSQIGQLDWCSYVFKNVVKACIDSKKNPAFVGGCIVFLMIAYFHRFDFQGESSPTTLPLIQHWDYDTLKERAAAEMKCGVLGMAVPSTTRYPICLQSKSSEGMTSDIGNEDSIKLIELFNRKRKFDQNTKEKPVKIKYNRLDTPSGALHHDETTDSAAEGLHELIMVLKRETEVFHVRYNYLISEIQQKIAANAPTESAEPVLSPLTPSQTFFADPELHRYVDEVVQISKAMKATNDKCPSFDKITQRSMAVSADKGKDGCVGGDLTAANLKSPPKTSEFRSNEGLNEIDPDDLVCGVLNDLGQRDVITNDESTTVSNDAIINSPVTVMMCHSSLHYPYLLHSKKLLSCSVLVPDDMGCTCDCGGDPEPNQIVVSKFLLSYRDLLSPIYKTRKDVLDYCFTDDHTLKLSENFVNYGEEFLLVRDDFLSMLPGSQIVSNVIDCWSIFLNWLLSLKRAPVNSSRCFFGTSHTDPLMKLLKAEKQKEITAHEKEVYGAWDFWISNCSQHCAVESDLVFIPLLSDNGDHYSCVCVNFLQQKIQYLDNRRYETAFQDTIYGQAAKHAANMMGNFLGKKGIKRGFQVKDFEFEDIPFDWKRMYESSNNDCGVFLMLHMLFFSGSIFYCDLANSQSRILYRAEMAAVLIMSDLNKCRDEVLGKVADFSRLKQSILPELLRKRQEASREVEIVEKTPTSKSVQLQRSSSRSVLGSTKRGQSDGLGCSLNCGPPDTHSLVVSKFLRNNKELFKDVKKKRKEVADYCFLDDYKTETLVEIVANYGNGRILNKEDVLSMLPDRQMSPIIVELWSILLNELVYVDQTSPSMIFFGIHTVPIITKVYENELQDSQMNQELSKLFDTWDAFVDVNVNPCNLNADLVFVPMVYENHYFCVCINCLKATVEVLDNNSYSDWENSDVYNLSKSIVGYMSDYLESKKLVKKVDVVHFPIINLPLQWQSTLTNDIESGTFCMMHMICYEGELFDSTLGGKCARRKHVVEMAASLVLADINTTRESILEVIDQFSNDKLIFWKYLEAKRKAEIVIARKALQKAEKGGSKVKARRQQKSRRQPPKK
ncbi:hypothetical protein RND81_12G022100 [Saponaria officinalis]